MNLIKNLSQLTTIQEASLEKINNILNYIHSNDIAEHLLSKCNEPIELELFEGTLILYVNNDVITYKFIPNKEFETIIVDSIIKKKNVLIDTLNENLKSKLLNIYKDIF